MSGVRFNVKNFEYCVVSIACREDGLQSMNVYDHDALLYCCKHYRYLKAIACVMHYHSLAKNSCS